MRSIARLAWLVLLFASVAASAQTVPPPQRPFGQLIELWGRQLDRISARTEQADLLPVEIDGLREQTTDVRAAAMAAAAFARNDLADTKKLLAPLELKPGTDAPPETDAVKADRERLTEQATVAESRAKQCEVVIARSDQLLERLTKLRGELVLRTLLRRDPSPLSPSVWRKVGPQFVASVETLSKAMTTWSRDGFLKLGSGSPELVPLGLWAAITIVLWWVGRALRRRFGRGGTHIDAQRDQTITTAIDGLGRVLVPILAVWLFGKLLLASNPPSPIDMLIPEAVGRLVVLLLVFGMTAAGLSPARPEWRVLPLTNDSAQYLSQALRRLFSVSLPLEFVYVALSRGEGRDAVAAIGAVVLTSVVAVLSLPALSNRAWQAARPEGSELPPMIGGSWWTFARLALAVAVLSSIVFSLIGYATLGAHLHSAISTTCLLIAIALLLHRLAADLLDAAAAPGSPSGAWLRRNLGLAPDTDLRGQYLVLLLFDALLVALLSIAIPAAWSVDTEAIMDGFGQLLRGVKVGGVTISLGNVGMAIVAFFVCTLLARLVRGIVRDRVLPTVDAPLPLRQSIDAGLNYAGVMIAILVGIGALGVDFTNLAIVLGALSVGIGLGLQNIANNVISGVILLVERPIKAGDWVTVSGHEGFVRRINIRATEIETFQRTHVIVPNSLFLQNPVVNRTYSDTSSRIEVKLTVPIGTDVDVMEAILREAALGHARVLRVPGPIVRFVKVGSDGLDFELFVFVARLEDRLIVTNDLNRAILAKLIERKVITPGAVPEFKVRGLDKVNFSLHADPSPETKETSPERPGDAPAAS
jgi:small-conductance mechanosensitive channel